jgi:hypothetical protein
MEGATLTEWPAVNERPQDELNSLLDSLEPYKERQEKKADAKAIAEIRDKLDKIEAADEAAAKADSYKYKIKAHFLLHVNLNRLYNLIVESELLVEISSVLNEPQMSSHSKSSSTRLSC